MYRAESAALLFASPASFRRNASVNADVRDVAREFEALFISIMLRSMRRTVGEGGLVPASLGERLYTELLDDQYARSIAAFGSVGLADLILEQIGGGNPSTRLSLYERQWNATRRFPSAVADEATLWKRVSVWEPLIAEAGARYSIDSSLIASVIAQESGGSPYAVSPAGAKGLMQLMDSTASSLGVRSVFDPRENIMAGSRYLRMMLDRYGGNEKLALASYNAGPAAVDKYRGVPPYRETQEYVVRVQQLREAFARMRTE